MPIQARIDEQDRRNCPCFDRLHLHAELIAELADGVAALGWPHSEQARLAAAAMQGLGESLGRRCPLREGAHPDAGCRRGREEVA